MKQAELESKEKKDKDSSQKPPVKRHKTVDLMFGGMDRRSSGEVVAPKKDDDSTFRIECERQLALYLKMKGMLMATTPIH